METKQSALQVWALSGSDFRGVCGNVTLENLRRGEMQFEQDGGSYVRKPQCLCSPECCGSVTLEGKKRRGEQLWPLRSSVFLANSAFQKIWD